MIVNGNLNLRSSTIESLGNLKEVKENKAMITDEFKALFPQELEAK